MASKTRGKNAPELTTEELITKVCTEFMQKLEDSMERKYSAISEKLNALNLSIEQMNQALKNNKDEIDRLNERVDMLEQFSKNNNLRINGMAEEVANEATIDKVMQFFTSELGVACSADDFNTVYRIGRYVDGLDNSPRTIIVNFVKQSKRTEVLKAKSRLKRNQISIFEDLTKLRFQLLKEAKKIVGFKNAWSRDGKIFVLCENEKKARRIYSEADLKFNR